jgi:cytidylate kinase
MGVKTKMIVTVDGPAASGKSTASKLLAERLKCLYLDTGAMYRAVALQAQRRGVHPEDRERLRDLCHNLDLRFNTEGKEVRFFIGNEDITAAIRAPGIDLLSSSISAVKEVRDALTQLQRKLAEKMNVVAEGRDMGTVVFPDAEFKFFLNASPDVRAGRRYKERIDRGEMVLREDVEKELVKRDEQDRARSIAPLIPARDAEIIDTTFLTPQQVVQVILATMRLRGREVPQKV